MNIIEKFLAFFSKNFNGLSLSFPNAPKDKKEYEQRKKKKIKIALNDFYFWDKMDVDLFKKNIEFLNKWICPYCNTTLPDRKGNAFKCPNCKNKIYRKREILSEKKGLFTEKDKQIVENLWSEYHKRMNFLEIYQYIDDIILPVPTVPEIANIFIQNVTDDNKKNIQLLIDLLHVGIPVYNPRNNRAFSKLRNCRFYEGEIERIFEMSEQAQSTFMQLLYLDMLDDETFIAPGIYDRAFDEDLPIEEFEKIFKFNANSLAKSLKFQPPITPDEAWEKILEYRKTLENS